MTSTSPDSAIAAAMGSSSCSVTGGARIRCVRRGRAPGAPARPPAEGAGDAASRMEPSHRASQPRGHGRPWLVRAGRGSGHAPRHGRGRPGHARPLRRRSPPPPGLLACVAVRCDPGRDQAVVPEEMEGEAHLPFARVVVQHEATAPAGQVVEVAGFVGFADEALGDGLPGGADAGNAPSASRRTAGRRGVSWRVSGCPRRRRGPGAACRRWGRPGRRSRRGP